MNTWLMFIELPTRLQQRQLSQRRGPVGHESSTQCNEAQAGICSAVAPCSQGAH